MQKTKILKVNTKSKEFMFNLGVLFAQGYNIQIKNTEEVNKLIESEKKQGYAKSFNMMIKFWQDNNLTPNIYTEEFDKNGVFFICPVRNATDKEKELLNAYLMGFEKQGKNVHYPQRDTNQNPIVNEINTGGYNICLENAIAMAKSKTIAVYYNKESVGSMFDLGVAYYLIKNNYNINFQILNFKIELNKNDFIDNKIIELFNINKERNPNIQDLFENITNKLSK